MSEPSPSPPPNDLSRLRIRRDDPAPRAGGSRRGLVVAIVLLVIGGATAAYMLRPRGVEVRVATASTSRGGGMTGDGITANGYVVAQTKASVSAKIAGRLVYLGVHEGSLVRSGQIIARIESDIYAAATEVSRADIGRLNVELAQARRDLERAEKLKADQLISTHDLENAQTRADLAAAALTSARAQLRVTEANLENTRVRAPFDGTVLRKDAEVGEIVAPAAAGGGLTRTAIVTMADLRTLEVEVDVNEAYIAQIRNGQEGRVTLDAYPDTSFRARVRQIVPTADRQKATVLVKVSILDRDPRILPEMGAKVLFLRDTAAPAVAAAPTRVTIPSGAVVRSGDRTSVWVVTGGTLASRDIQLGAMRGDQYEVTQGLSGGETVVVEPGPGLKQGQKARVSAKS